MIVDSSQNEIFKLLEYIAVFYFGNLHCLAVFELQGKTDNFEEISWSTHNVIYDIENLEQLHDNVLTSMNLGCGSYIAKLSDSYSANIFFDSYAEAVFKADRRIADRKMVIVFASDEYISIEEQKQILNHSLFQDFPDVLLITKASQESYDLSTTQYVGAYNQTERIYLDTWYQNGSFEVGSNLFPNKIINMEGRSLRLAMFNYKPYSIWSKVSSGGSAGFEDEGPASRGTADVDGTEVRASLEFCLKHNCTISLVLEEENMWGEIYENGTGVGILGALSEGRADVGISALYTWYHEYGFLDLSLPMVRTGITVVAPAPSLKSGWSMPIRPFSPVLWIAVLISISITIISSYILNRINNVPNTSISGETFDIIRNLLLQPPGDAENSNRYMLAGLLLLSLMLSNAYGGGLASVMTVPIYSAPIDTVDDLASSNMEWGATSNAWIFSILSATEPNLIKLVSMFRDKSEEDLHQRSRTNQFAFSVERLPAGHFAIGDYLTEEVVGNFRLMKEDLYWEQCVAMMPKSSPILNSYNMHILRLLETGLPAVWESQVSMKYMNNKVQLGVLLSRQRMHDQTGPVNLRPDHLLGVYAAWGFGMIISTCVFIIELLMKRVQNNKIQNAVIDSIYDDPTPGFSGDMD